MPTLSRGEWLWEEAIGEQVLRIPSWSALFRLPAPEDPPGSLLECVHLRLDELADSLLSRGRQLRDAARGVLVAAADVGRASKRAVVSSTFSISIEVFGAISHRARPLSGNGPLVAAGHLTAEAASSADVARSAHTHGALVKDFIVVSVFEQCPHAATPTVPGCNSFEAVVEGDGDVGSLEVAP